MLRYLTGGLILCAISSGVVEQGGTRMFVFDSGGAYHPEGFGAWQVKVEGDVADIEHRVGKRVTRYATIRLTRAEIKELWVLVDGAGLDKLPSADDKAPPDATVATFAVSRGAVTRRVTVRLDSQWESSPLMALVHGITRLIEKHTGERPVLR